MLESSLGAILFYKTNTAAKYTEFYEQIKNNDRFHTKVVSTEKNGLTPKYMVAIFLITVIKILSTAQFLFRPFFIYPGLVMKKYGRYLPHIY